MSRIILNMLLFALQFAPSRVHNHLEWTLKWTNEHPRRGVILKLHRGCVTRPTGGGGGFRRQVAVRRHCDAPVENLHRTGYTMYSMYYGSPPRESFAIRNAWSLKCLATVPRLDSYFITEERKHSSIWSWVADASINCNVGRRWGGTELIKYLFQSATFRGAFTSVEELAQVGCRASRSTTLRRNPRRAHLTYINEIAFLNFALSFSSCDSENCWTVSNTYIVFFCYLLWYFSFNIHF